MSEEKKKSLSVIIAESLLPMVKESNSGELDKKVYDQFAEEQGLTKDVTSTVNAFNKEIMAAAAIVTGKLHAERASGYADPMAEQPPTIVSIGNLITATASGRMTGAPPKDGVPAERSPSIVVTVKGPSASKSVVRDNLAEAQLAFKAACGATS